jgi:hypothetical protein
MYGMKVKYKWNKEKLWKFKVVNKCSVQND